MQLHLSDGGRYVISPREEGQGERDWGSMSSYSCPSDAGPHQHIDVECTTSQVAATYAPISRERAGPPGCEDREVGNTTNTIAC
jgi:hypothetical protein